MAPEQRTSEDNPSIGRRLLASWDKLIFVVSLLILAFGAGVAMTRYKLPPYDTMITLADAAKDWAINWPMKLGIEPTQHLVENRHQGTGLVEFVEAKSSPGVTLFESVFDGNVGLRLYDHQGRVLHTWDALFSEIDPDTTIVLPSTIPTNDWETMIHGAALYPNGDVVFNLPGITMVKMDVCGDVLWKLPATTHHSLMIAEDGNIWALGLEYYLDEPDPKFPGMIPQFEDDYVLEISPDGEILRQISILELLYANDLVGALFPTGAMRDMIHTNDVEILSKAHADAFPLFDAGDAVVSLRNLNMLFVFDPDTGVIKWWQTGPWLRQHDPDFMPDGRISVFDNRADRADGRVFGGSRILAIDPVSRKFETLYQGTPEEPFFSDTQGKVDLLENGNLLITESYGGRVFEVTPQGEIVWSFIHRYDEERLISISGATRYPESYGDFDTSMCH